MAVSSTLESETLIEPGRSESLTVYYRYNNDLDRLIGTSGNRKAGNASVDYDALGNITQLVTHNRTLDYHYNTALNRLTSVNGSGAVAKSYSSFDYDTRGNITNNSHVEMSYNLANQMTAALGKSYTYDGHNRRVKVAGDGDTRYYLYSQSGQLLLSEDNGVQTNYIYLGSKLIAEDRQATTTFIHTDRLGSPVARTNSTGRVESRRHYQPFGDTYEAPSDDIGYTGHKYDNDSGLSYMQQRYYDPIIGRFYSNDPVDAFSHLSSTNGTHGFNRYAYANNNPYKYVDPDGRVVVVASRPLKLEGVGGFGSHTMTIVSTGKSEPVIFSSLNINGKNVFAENHPVDVGALANGKINDFVVIEPPKGMTSEQFDEAVLSQGRYMSTRESLDYSALSKLDGRVLPSEGNCHTSTTNLINGAGGNIPKDFNAPGGNPDLNHNRITDDRPRQGN
ncbi:RHS repeat domain-containing protein [Pseudidiomarina sp. PP-1MA]|uniref:RHS repeat domain-containing protein n=1 Tax=Pseudidiomarina sp. PP-1MA TaxID=3237706 RepID=A0AB39X5I7_9GAMM